MAFKRGTNNLSPARAYEKAINAMTSIKNGASSHKTKMAAGTESRDDVVSLFLAVSADIVTLQTLRDVDGVGPYAKDQVDDPAYDVVVEFDAVKAALVAVQVEIVATQPTGTGDWLQTVKFNAAGDGLDRPVFTSAQTATLQTLLTTVDNSII